MSKFREGEVVRSILKGDENYPFFKIIRFSERDFELTGRKVYLVRKFSNHAFFIEDYRTESALRHTEFDSAGDE